MSTYRSVQAGHVLFGLICASIVDEFNDNEYELFLLICSSLLSLQFHNTRSQKGEKEKEKDKQPDIPLDSDEEPADADLSLMARTKRRRLRPPISVVSLRSWRIRRILLSNLTWILIKPRIILQRIWGPLLPRP